jgi:hypothetical protein
MFIAKSKTMNVDKITYIFARLFDPTLRKCLNQVQSLRSAH